MTYKNADSTERTIKYRNIIKYIIMYRNSYKTDKAITFYTTNHFASRINAKSRRIIP